MPRKTTGGGRGTLQKQRERLRRNFSQRGSVFPKEIKDDAKLTDIERATKKDLAILLKAAGFSDLYVAEACGVSQPSVSRWFKDEGLQARMFRVRQDLIEGGVQLLHTYMFEIIETEMFLLRNSGDERLAAKIGFELLDRMGLAKITKTESTAQITTNETVDIHDKTGLLEHVKDAPPHVQAKMAQAMEEIVAMAREHTEGSE